MRLMFQLILSPACLEENPAADLMEPVSLVQKCITRFSCFRVNSLLLESESVIFENFYICRKSKN